MLSNNVGCNICLYEHRVRRHITEDKTLYLSRSVAETFLSVCRMTARTQTVLFIYAQGTVSSGCAKQSVWKGWIKPRKDQKIVNFKATGQSLISTKERVFKA